MNTFSINDEQFKKTELYKDFIKDNPTHGYLKIKAFSADEAVPIPGVQITISTIYKSIKIVYYEGETNSSGIIEKIILPTPKVLLDSLDEPNKILYEIKTNYMKEQINNIYEVSMYEGICTIQNINITPNFVKEDEIKWQ